jgi:glycosyltransferase involved in cell wall biosynthesis
MVIEYWGREIKPDSEVWYIKRTWVLQLPFLGWIVYGALFLCLLFRAKKMKGALSFNNYGEVFPFIADFSYVHSKPIFGASPNENPYHIPFWAFFTKLYIILAHMMKSFFNVSNILANSKYDRNLIHESLGRMALVLYPPIETCLLPSDVVKRPQVLTISRLNPGKDLEDIPRIAALVSGDVGFIVTGPLAMSDPRLLGSLRRASASLRLVLNPTQGTLTRMRLESSIYLSTQRSEAFGLAIVEAMACGCVPLTPRDGGPWIDILDRRQGEYGYAYSSVAEAASIIDRLLSDDSLRAAVSERARLRSTRFSSERFERSLRRILVHIRAG